MLSRVSWECCNSEPKLYVKDKFSSTSYTIYPRRVSLDEGLVRDPRLLENQMSYQTDVEFQRRKTKRDIMTNKRACTGL